MNDYRSFIKYKFFYDFNAKIGKFFFKSVYPYWANLIGWCITFSSMLCIPIMACYQLAKAKGTFTEVNFFLNLEIKVN